DDHGRPLSLVSHPDRPDQPLTRASTSSVSAATVSASAASTLSRSSGSVLDGRRLDQCPSGIVTVTPSSSSSRTPPGPPQCRVTAARRDAGSSTDELISPDMEYRP